MRFRRGEEGEEREGGGGDGMDVFGSYMIYGSGEGGVLWCLIRRVGFSF